MSIVFLGLYFVISAFILVMIVRLILDYVVLFNRNWRPSGFLLVVAEAVYTITDPPLRFVRRFIKPIRFGEVSLDLSWTIVMLVAIILSYVVTAFL